MKKKALIKMLDTYIQQLKELRKDINNIIIDDEVENIYTSEEVVEKILNYLNDRDMQDIENILKELEYRLIIKGVLSDRYKNIQLTDIHINEFEKFLLNRKIKYEKAKYALCYGENAIAIYIRDRDGNVVITLMFNEKTMRLSNINLKNIAY